jgi:hypothetical protein
MRKKQRQAKEIANPGNNLPPEWVLPWSDDPLAAEQRRAADAYISRLIKADFEDRSIRGEIGRLLGVLISSPTKGAREGKDASIGFLVDFCRMQIDIVTEATRRYSWVCQRLAGLRSLWPVMVTPHDASLEDARQLTKKIGLGKETGIAFEKRKPFKWENESEIAAELYLELLTRKNFPERFGWWEDDWRKRVSNLPLLCKKMDVITAWWEPVQALFNDQYGPAFETNRRFFRHWASATFAPLGTEHDPNRKYKLHAAWSIYQQLMDCWLNSDLPDAAVRLALPDYHGPRASNYQDDPKGSWQYVAKRLPPLTIKDSATKLWFEAALLLNGDPDIGFRYCFSKQECGAAYSSPETAFALYMMNTFRQRNAIRKHIKDLLRQGLESIAAEERSQKHGGT